MPSHQKLIRAWAGVDLALTGLLVFPPVAASFISLMLGFGGLFGGRATLESLGSFGLMFVSITGALGVVWAVARLLRPTRTLALADAVARTWVGGLILYFVLFAGVPVVFTLFVVTEWAGAAHQGLRLLRPARQPSA